LGGRGVVVIPGALDLRGLDVDAKGRLWVADVKGSRVHVVNPAGAVVNSIPFQRRIDVACDAGRIYVTQHMQRTITVLGDDMNVLETLTVPWDELELSPSGNNNYGALSGISVVPGSGFFVSNETGQTAGEKSTYGREDDFTDLVNGKVYRDSFGGRRRTNPARVVAAADSAPLSQRRRVCSAAT
jgi:DNA-binding beta-propeller fold protein YncE